MYGYHDDQRTSWVGAGKAAALVKDVVAAGIAVEAPGSRRTPRTAATGKLGQEKQPPATAATLVLPDTPASPASSTSQTAQATAYEAANKMLGPGGQHVEALGSDAQHRWMQENAVEEMNGSYWQHRQLSTGEMALVQVQIPKEVLEAEQLGNAEISSMMFRSLEGDTQALMKKVAFNPETFTYFSWVKRKGFLGPNKDFADFINYCVTLTMTKIFGARIGVIINTDNTLMGILKERKENMEVEYAT